MSNTKFYKKYQDEINELLSDAISGTGLYDLSELFGDKWRQGKIRL